jgi:hypothetical protein
MKIGIFQAFAIFGAVAKVVQNYKDEPNIGIGEAIAVGIAVLVALGRKPRLNGVPIPADLLSDLIEEAFGLIKGGRLDVADLMAFVTNVCNKLGVQIEFEK